MYLLAFTVNFARVGLVTLELKFWDLVEIIAKFHDSNPSGWIKHFEIMYLKIVYEPST